MPELRGITRNSRLQSFLTVIVATVLFFLVVGIVDRCLGRVLHDYASRSLRARATITITGAMIGEIIVLAILTLYLRSRGQSLRDLGLWRPAPVRGWIAAALFTALFLWLTFAGALRGHTVLAEMSFFHIYNSLVAGLSQGSWRRYFFAASS